MFSCCSSKRGPRAKTAPHTTLPPPAAPLPPPAPEPTVTTEPVALELPALPAAFVLRDDPADRAGEAAEHEAAGLDLLSLVDSPARQVYTEARAVPAVPVRTPPAAAAAPPAIGTPKQQNQQQIQKVLRTPDWAALVNTETEVAAAPAAAPAAMAVPGSPAPGKLMPAISCSNNHPLMAGSTPQKPEAAAAEEPPATPITNLLASLPLTTPKATGGPELCRIDVSWKQKLGKFNRAAQRKLVTQLVCAGTDDEWAAAMAESMLAHRGRMAIRGPVENHLAAFSVLRSIPSLTVSLSTPSKVPQNGLPRATGQQVLETPQAVGIHKAAKVRLRSTPTLSAQQHTHVML